MKEYFVVARKWSNEHNEIVLYVAGKFNDYNMAMLFKRSYEEHYKSSASIIDSGIWKGIFPPYPPRVRPFLFHTWNEHLFGCLFHAWNEHLFG